MRSRYLSLHEITIAHDMSVPWRLVALFGFVGAMWLVHGFAALIGGAGPDIWGIVPREIDGLGGILVSPFIHDDLEHLAANTVPLMALGLLILLRGLREYVIVVQIGILVGGAGTWLFGTPDSVHFGASGVVFAFFGFLLFRTVFDHSWGSALVTVAVAALYGTSFVFSLVPEDSTSWSGHFFGFAGGVLAARHVYRRKQAASKQAAAILESVGLRGVD